MTKTKKQNIDRELLIGGGFLLFSAPMILLSISASIFGIVIALVSGVPIREAVLMILSYGIPLLIFGGVLYAIYNRFRLLHERKQQLLQERNRVQRMISSHSAGDRLRIPDHTTHRDYLYNQELSGNNQQRSGQ